MPGIIQHIGPNQFSMLQDLMKPKVDKSFTYVKDGQKVQ